MFSFQAQSSDSALGIVVLLAQYYTFWPKSLITYFRSYPYSWISRWTDCKTKVFFIFLRIKSRDIYMWRYIAESCRLSHSSPRVTLVKLWLPDDFISTWHEQTFAYVKIHLRKDAIYLNFSFAQGPCLSLKRMIS